MRVILNEQGYVDSYALLGNFGVSSIEVVDPVDVVDFEKNYSSYFLYDGMLVKNEDKQREIKEKAELDELRTQREKICFPYINRGFLWYNKLTEEQKEDLNIWYQSWLDVTETKVIPEKPEWLINF